MTSTWGNWHGSWERSDADDGRVADALDDEDPAALAKWLAARDFTLIDEGDTLDGGTAALMLEFEGRPAVVAFTSQQHVGPYLLERDDLFDDPQSVKTALVAGRNLVRETPTDSGILIDPETDEELYLPPELVDRIRAEFAPRDSIAKAVANNNAASLAAWLRSMEFWLIEEPDFSNDEALASMVLEIEGNPAVAAFTSNQGTRDFTGANLHLLEGRKQFKAFVVSGEAMIKGVRPGAGVIIDTDTDKQRYFSPKLVEQIRAEFT